MQYNFDEIIDRTNTNALNTDGFRGYIFHAGPDMRFPYADDEFIRMWVADMEFATPPEVCDALKNRVDRRIFGYTQILDDSFYNDLVAWCEANYNWRFPKEELVISPGIIPALYELVGDLLAPDEKLLITTPAYGYFQHAAEFASRELVTSDLLNDKGYFTIDFTDLERKASDPKVKLLLWCQPHNPTGRIWTAEETKKVVEIAKKYDLWLISDEIHCDLIRSDQRHIPTAKIEPDYKKLITCMAASKTFNLAGLMFSSIIVRDEQVRAQMAAHDKLFGCINPLSLVATQAAYRHGQEWLRQLKTYLDENFAFVKTYLSQHLPHAIFTIPQATYLAWVDLRHYFTDEEDLPMFFANEAGVLLEGGDALFVGNAGGFIRLNVAMSKPLVKEGVKRICSAVLAHKSAN